MGNYQYNIKVNRPDAAHRDRGERPGQPLPEQLQMSAGGVDGQYPEPAG